MADQEKNTEVRNYDRSAYIGEDIPNDPSEYREETAAEIAAPVPLVTTRGQGRERENLKAANGSGIGYVGLALAILSLFFMPILLGAAGIVLGFIARSRGATGLGAWAIGIGAVSMIIGIFILPFF
jgi:hypothetical protein